MRSYLLPIIKLTKKCGDCIIDVGKHWSTFYLGLDETVRRSSYVGMVTFRLSDRNPLRKYAMRGGDRSNICLKVSSPV